MWWPQRQVGNIFGVRAICVSYVCGLRSGQLVIRCVPSLRCSPALDFFGHAAMIANRSKRSA